MSTDAKRKWTVEEYLAMERAGEQKHEFLDGEVRLMTGFNRNHSVIQVNAGAILHNQLRTGNLSVFPSAMRLKINGGRLYTYADASVIRDPGELEDEYQDTMLNPILIIEVLSPSSEAYDRGKKFQHYQEQDSLQEYVLISHDHARIERYRRKSSREWLFSDAVGLEAMIDLPTIECTLPLADVYHKVNFEPDEAAPPT